MSIKNNPAAPYPNIYKIEIAIFDIIIPVSAVAAISLEV